MSTKPDQTGTPAAGHPGGGRRLTLISRRDCHLCEEMAAVVETAAAEVPFELEVLDVDGDPDLLARYSDKVPVLLIDGDEAFEYRATLPELVALLRTEPRDR